MKISGLFLAAVCSAPLLNNSILIAQSSAAPAATPSAAAGVGQEAKEKAEDAVLLQQLESDQPVRAESRGKVSTQWSPGLVTRGGGGAGMAGPVTVQYRNVLSRSGHRALVIRSTDADAKSEAALEEDLGVMSHLLNKALEELPGGAGNPNKVMGIDVFFSQNATPVRSLYLENYGAVFLLNVNFPLIAPPEKHTEEKPVGDSAWDEAWQELYGQRAQGIGEAAEDYNPEKVDKLKDILFETLKNATNIRGLSSEEFVTVWVCGGNSSGTAKIRGPKNNPPGGNKEGNIVLAEQLSPGRRTVLTVRVKKNDIDAYAKGKLSPEEFRKHTKLLAYTGGSSANSNELFGLGGFGSARAVK